MKTSLKSICIVGIIGTSLLTVHNLIKLFFPEIYGTYIYLASEITIGSIFVYAILALYYIVLCAYFFNKKLLLTGVAWAVQFLMLIWYITFLRSDDVFDPAFYEMLQFKLQIKSTITIAVGAIFIFSLRKKHIWLSIFGFLIAISALPIFVKAMVPLMSSWYFYMGALLPILPLINYYLELKKIGNLKKDSGFDSEIIDVNI